MMAESLLEILARLAVPAEAFAELAGIDRDDIYAIAEGAALPSPRAVAVLRLLRNCGAAKLAPIIAALADLTEAREWRPVPGFPAYEVSSDGFVRRRTSSGKGSLRVLKAMLKNHGYYSVTLYRDGRAEPQRVHRIVCEAFHGEEPPDRPYACHKDGTRTNNREGNLYWGSAADNSADWQQIRRSRIASAVHSKYSPDWRKQRILLERLDELAK